MPNTTFFSDNIAYINGVCNAYVGENVTATANAIKPAAFTLLGVYVILWGFASVRGMIREPFHDMAARVVKLSLVFGIGIGLAEYNVLVTDTFINGPDQVAGILAHAPTAGTTIGGLDALWDKGFAVGARFWAKAGMLTGDFGMYLIALAVFTTTIVVTSYAFFLIVLAKVMLSVLVGLGALFILGLLFEPTSGYFNSWLRQMSNYFLVPVLVTSVNLLVMTLFGRAADGANMITATTSVDQVFPFVAMGLISFLALAQILALAAGLAGGVSLSSMGMGRFALNGLKSGGKRIAGGAGKAAFQTAKIASIPARKAASAGWSAYKGRAKNSISNP
jgi:type IV secretion system protein VirB6